MTLDEVRIYDRILNENEINYLSDNTGWLNTDLTPPDNDMTLDAHEIDTNAVELSWFAGYGSSYQAQYAPHLQTTNWVDFGDAVLGDNSTNNVVDLTTNAARLYRVEIVE